jgi:hypothetical protein
MRGAVFKETVSLAESFQWRNDSVWWFLHALISNSLVSPDGTSVFEMLARKLFGSEEVHGPREEGLLGSKWYQSYWERKSHET